MSPPPVTLFGLYNDELETYLDEIDRDSPCLFNTLVAILLYVDTVVQLSKLGAGQQSILNKLYEFYTSSSFEVNLSQPKNHVIWPHQKEIKPRGILPRQRSN